MKIGVWEIIKDTDECWRAYHENYDGAPDGNNSYFWDYSLEDLLHQLSEWENG